MPEAISPDAVSLINSLMLAAAPVPAGAPPASVWSLMLQGGVMMIPLAVCSLVVVAVTAERLATLTRARVAPKGFADELDTLLARGADGIADARTLCQRSNTPLARLADAGLQRAGRPIDEIERHMAAAGEHELFDLRKRMRALSVVASAAPLLGLIGTIFGMIRAFRSVAASGEALGRTEVLAEGIYEALTTTAAGLLVAVPALMAYHWFSGKIERLTRELDRVCVPLAERLAAFAPDRRRSHAAQPEILHAEATPGDSPAAAATTAIA